ncbi:hypothetical protein ACKWTF_015909 [Chironomus riparius]
MEETNENFSIENISEEVWVHIFSFLEVKSLEEVSKVCSRFYSLILQNKKLQSKLSLEINRFNVEEVIKKMERLPYKSININTGRFRVRQDTMTIPEFSIVIENIFKQQNHDIEKLEVTNVRGNFIIEHFRFFQNLSKLILIDVKIDLSGLYLNNDVINIPNLKFLKIYRCSDVVTSLFRAENLKIFMYQGYENYEFLKFSTKLENLTIVDFRLNNLKKIIQLELKLKYLSLFIIPEDEYIDSVQFDFKHFLITQQDSLQQLSIEINKMGVEFVELCLTKLQKLTKFSFKTNKSTFLNFPIFCVNNSIKDFEIDGKINLDSCNLISWCPSATLLTLCMSESSNFNILEHISTTMLNLRTLKIQTKSANYEYFNQKLKFENLEILKISNIQDNCREIWHKVAISCPNLKELTLMNHKIIIDSKIIEMVLRKCQNFASNELLCKVYSCFSVFF